MAIDFLEIVTKYQMTDPRNRINSINKPYKPRHIMVKLLKEELLKATREKIHPEDQR